MTEWEYQDHFTASYLTQPLQVDDENFYLVGWEVMFPSWRMNDKTTGRWEKSIDFIFFDLKHTFLLLEMKARVNTLKQFDKAKHQLQERIPLFLSSYNEDNIRRIIRECHLSYRTRDIAVMNIDFNFPEINNLKILPFIGAPEGKFEAARMAKVSDPLLRLWSCI